MIPMVETITRILKINKGYLSAEDIKRNNICASAVRKMEKQKIIEKVDRGLYMDTRLCPDKHLIIQRKYHNGIFSHLTALYFHGLSDRVPLVYDITYPSNQRVPTIKNKATVKCPEIRIFRTKKEHFELGATQAETIEGNTVRLYDAPRSVCDSMKHIDRLDRDLVLTALKRYARNPENDTELLLEYAKTFGIHEQIIICLEMLT
jgi:predicted transcriptional regulator of viral defense system